MSREVGKKVTPRAQTWVQTEREAHVQWGRLVVSNPLAAAVMHQLVAIMDRNNAVCISHQTLADLVGCHYTTVKRALKYLEKNNWVQVVQLGVRGTVNAYVINERVAWADYRDNKKLAIFSARIVADAADQSQAALSPGKLRRVPIIHPPEEALPAGEWPPGSQAQLPGMESVVVGPPRDDEHEEMDLIDPAEHDRLPARGKR
ncbi:helix-turn-helix domain-containing protein [Azospirillum sp. sgz302134]